MKIQALDLPKDWSTFHAVPHYIYQNDALWIAHLERDIEQLFDPSHNQAFQQEGRARLWVLQNEKGQGIGRIAAFVDGKRNAQIDRTEGGIGFFECIHDDTAAALLFQTAEDYLRQAGMTVINGPINFGERDRYWGLLTKGWYQPLYQENYNPPYYERSFEQAGFLPQEQVFTFGGKIADVDHQRLQRLAGMIRKRYGVQSRMLNMKDLRGEAEHLAQAYNATFQQMTYFNPINGDLVYQAFQQMKPVMDPRLCCLCFVDEVCVGFCAMMPDINPALAFGKGKLRWWQIPRFLYRLKYLRPKNVKGVSFGIRPKYQRIGVFAEMVEFMTQVDNQHVGRTYESLALATIRGFNTPMLNSMTGSLNLNIERVHVSFTKILDESPYVPLGTTDVSAVAWGEVPELSVYPVA